jgi:hypothetical protein
LATERYKNEGKKAHKIPARHSAFESIDKSPSLSTTCLVLPNLRE